MLSRIRQLSPQRFYFLRPDELAQEGLPHLVTTEGHHFGVTAQQMEEFFPELVRDVRIPMDPDSESTNDELNPVTIKAVNYTELIPVLIAGIQEQQPQIEELKARVEALENN